MILRFSNLPCALSFLFGGLLNNSGHNHGGHSILVSAKIIYIEDFGGIPDSKIHNHPKEPVHYTEFFHSFTASGDEDMNSKNVHHHRLSVNFDHSTTESVINANNIGKLGQQNTASFNKAIQSATYGDIIQLKQQESYTFLGGVIAENKVGITIDFAGYTQFIYDKSLWPSHTPSQKDFDNSSLKSAFNPAIHVLNSRNVTLTSSATELNRAIVRVDYENNEIYLDKNSGSGGLIDGHGKKWWNDAIMGSIDGDSRPRLCFIQSSKDVLVEYLTFVNSAFWTLTVEAIGAEIRYVNVLVDRNYQRELKNNTKTLKDGIKNEAEAKVHYMNVNTQGEGIRGNYAEGRRTRKRTRRLREVSSQSSSSRLKKFRLPKLPSWALQPQDLNTDGIDPIGTNIWVHDCIVLNDDDSIAVKPSLLGQHASILNGTIAYKCTRDIKLENLVLTGFGASVGSVGPNHNHPCVDNITFRNINMPGTGKGIYIKSNKSDCNHGETSSITNIRYENIYIKQPMWWPIWIGPQAQHEPHEELGGNCPLDYPIGNTPCRTQGCATFENITLKDVFVEDPLTSPGVILGNSTNPMKNIVFENVTMEIPLRNMAFHGRLPFHQKRFPYSGIIQCKHAIGTCKGCSPRPGCLDLTSDSEG